MSERLQSESKQNSPECLKGDDRGSLIDPMSELLLEPIVVEDNEISDLGIYGIIDHNRVRIGEEIVELSPTQITLFNTLRCMRDGYLSTTDLAQANDYVASHVNTRMPDLCTALGDVIEVVHQKGGRLPTLYRLNPDVVFVDERHGWPDREFFTRRHVVYDNDQPVIENDTLKYKSKADKVNVGSAMMRDFGDHPAVYRAVTRLMNEMATQSARPTLDIDEEHLLFEAIEQAMVVYVRQGTALLDHEMATIVAGVEAAHGLYFSHSHLIERSIQNLPINFLMWTLEDLRQEASIALMEGILRGLPEARQDLPFAMIVPTMIRNSVITKSIETEWSNGQKRGIRLYRDFNEIRKAQRRLQAIQDHTVTREEIAVEVGMSVDRVKDLMDYGSQTHGYLGNAAYSNSTAAEERTFADLVDEVWFSDSLDYEIEQHAMKDDIDALFASDVLSDNEKAVISLYHGLFSPRLCGAELLSGRRDRGARIVFTYPYDEETFFEVARQTETLKALDDFLGLVGFSAKHYRTGLQKAAPFIERHGKSIF